MRFLNSCTRNWLIGLVLFRTFVPSGSAFVRGVSALSDSTILSFTNISDSLGYTGPGPHATVFADVTGDGRPDLYITRYDGSVITDLFYRNLDGRRFSEEAGIRGIGSLDGGSHGAVFADLDNDGDYDLINGVTADRPTDSTKVPAPIRIYENDGNGYFTDVTHRSPDILRNAYFTRAVLAFDMDGDGPLDILAVSGSRGSDRDAEDRNEVYRNIGNLTFVLDTLNGLYNAPLGQGATDTDYDGDGHIDVIGANRTGEVNILRNDGTGRFTLISARSLGINHMAKDGVTMGDIDNDGHLDMVLVSGSTEGELAVYRGHGDGNFEFTGQSWPQHGYMAALGDLDNDGYLDLVSASDTSVFLNDGYGAFYRGPYRCVSAWGDFRGVALADIDGDGDLDFSVADKQWKSRLIRNDLQGGGAWLKIRLISPQGQAGAFGARVYVTDSQNSLVGMREARSSNGYLAQNDPVLHVGLGSRSTVNVRVRFPDGTWVSSENVQANQTITVDGRQSEVMDRTAPPAGFGLSDNYPNPFNPQTALYLSLPVNASVSVIVTDILGRMVRRLHSGFMQAGTHCLVWDGLDDGLRAAASGIYLLSLEAGAFRAVRKMILIR